MMQIHTVRLSITLYLLVCASLRADPIPPIQRYLPPTGLLPPKALSTQLQERLSRLRMELAAIGSPANPNPDVEIYLKAVDYALRHREFYKEKDFDLYTALIGSGPAYVFYIIEAMLNASRELDLEEDKKKELIIEMIKGSSSLAKMSDDGLETLRSKVTSKGGVTERAIEILEENEMKEVLLKAISEGAKRSKLLGEEKK